MSYKFKLFRSTKNNQYYWNFKAPNGERVAHSEGYVQRQGALNGITSVKRNAVAGNYTVFKGRDGQWYWNLKAPNHEIIAHSEGYVAEQGAQHAIGLVRQHAPSAPIEE